MPKAIAAMILISSFFLGVSVTIAQDSSDIAHLSMQEFVDRLLAEELSDEEATRYISDWNNNQKVQFLTLVAQRRGLSVPSQVADVALREGSSFALTLSAATHIPATTYSAGTIHESYHVVNTVCDGDPNDSEFLFVYNAVPNNLSGMRWYNPYISVRVIFSTLYNGRLLVTPVAAGTKTGMCIGDTGVNLAGGVDFIAAWQKLKP